MNLEENVFICHENNITIQNIVMVLKLSSFLLSKTLFHFSSNLGGKKYYGCFSIRFTHKAAVRTWVSLQRACLNSRCSILMCMGALISLRFSVLVLLQAIFTANTPICGHIYSVHHSSICSSSLSFSLSLAACLSVPPPPLLPPSSLPYCTNSLHKISHLLTQFTEIHFPPNPKTHTGVHVHSFVGGGCWSLVFRMNLCQFSISAQRYMA